MKLLDGRALRDRIFDELRPRIAALSRNPTLAIVSDDDGPEAEQYARNKVLAGQSIGVRVVIGGPEDLRRFNGDPDIDAILVQQPFRHPPGATAENANAFSVTPSKDADGCTADGIVELLLRNGIEIAGRRAVVVGRNAYVARPIAMRLLDHDATVKICHSKTLDLAAECRWAEILVTATGKPGLITIDHVADGAVVIDVGTALVDGKFVGDLAPGAADRASAGALVPGGVGPMTIAALLAKTVELAERSAERQRREEGMKRCSGSD